MRLKSLIENRGNLVVQLRKFADAINAPGYDVTAEDQSKFDSLKLQIGVLDKAIEREKGIDEIEKIALETTDFESRAPDIFKERHDSGEKITAADRSNALRGWLQAGKGNRLTDSQRASMKRLGVDGDQKEMVITLPSGETSAGELQEVWRNGNSAQRAAMLQGRIGATGLLTSSSTAGAGFMSPGTIASQVEVALLAYGGVRQLAEIYTTGSDNGAFKVPTANDTSNTGELLTEQSSIGSTTDTVISSKTYNLYKFSSKLMKFTAEMLADSVFNLPNFLGQLAGVRLGRITNTNYTTGAGSTVPSGVRTDSSAGVTAAATTAVTGDELIDLVHSLDPAYWPGASWMFNNTTAKILRKLKDGDSNYLWRDAMLGGLSSGFSSGLLGFPITINQDMDAMTAGLKPIIFGDFSKYKIRSLPEIRLRRLSELYAATDEEGMIAFKREDGGLLDAGTHPLKRITMAP